MMSGWVYFIITTVLFITFCAFVFHYYKPKRREDVEHEEQPKYRMLDDDKK
jgi:cbb3-type cytochrome oxidase subunit 3